MYVRVRVLVRVHLRVYGDNRGLTHEYTPYNRGQGPN